MGTIYHTGFRITFSLAALTTLIICQGLPNAGAQNTRTIRLDQGTVIPVKLEDKLSSDNSQPGDPFTATVKADSNGTYLGLPAGTRIEGIVKDARPQMDRDPGVLDLSFRRVRTPDGRSYPIQGSLIGLDSKSVERTNDGRLVAKPGHKNDRLTYVGYGAGAGLIVGLLTKKPLEDTAIGAGLGYLFGALDKSNNNPKNVVLKPGTEMGVRVDSRMTVSGYSSGYNNRNSDYDTGNRYENNSTYSNTYGNERFHRGEATRDIAVMFDQDSVNFRSNAPPVMVNGVTLLPAIPVLRAAHVPFTYDSGRQTIITSGNAGTMRLSVGSRVAIMNDSRRVRFNSEARQINGTIYVPARFLGLATDSDVQFDEATRTVIFTPKSEM